MNRAEKRQTDRLEIWFNSLSEDKKQMINDRITQKIDSNNSIMNAISDICTVSALDDILDVNIFEIKDIITKTKEYMIDYGEYLEKNKNGGIKMIENEVIRNQIKDKIRKFMKGKMDKARGLKLLKHEFDLPFAELSDLWLECKNDNCAKEIDKDTTVESCPNAEIHVDKEIVDDITNLISKGIENMNHDPNDNKEKIIGPEKKINLRVIKVTTEVQGEYGTYIKTVDGVKIEDNLYSDIDMVKKEKTKIAAEYNTKMDDIKNKIKLLNHDLKNIQDVGMREMERFTEIESVFNL